MTVRPYRPDQSEASFRPATVPSGETLHTHRLACAEAIAAPERRTVDVPWDAWPGSRT
jgi:hypothetical protein